MIALLSLIHNALHSPLTANIDAILALTVESDHRLRLQQSRKIRGGG